MLQGQGKGFASKALWTTILALQIEHWHQPIQIGCNKIDRNRQFRVRRNAGNESHYGTALRIFERLHDSRHSYDIKFGNK